jgi:uncharacterized protein (UPF0548 family)
MFRLSKPTDREVEREIAATVPGLMRGEYLAGSGGVRRIGLPTGFVLDRLRNRIGEGRETFVRSIQEFRNWTQFNIGWVRVANSSARIEIGQTVAVEVHSLGLWSLNLSQMVDVMQTESRFGFIYKTTPGHVEVTLDERSDTVWYETEAVSRPRDLMALLGYPVTRAFQHRFARDSHRCMQVAVGCR